MELLIPLLGVAVLVALLWIFGSDNLSKKQNTGENPDPSSFWSDNRYDQTLPPDKVVVDLLPGPIKSPVLTRVPLAWEHFMAHVARKCTTLVAAYPRRQSRSRPRARV